MASGEQLAEREDRRHVADPSRTKTIQREYAQKLRGRFADINTEIRAAVRDRDVFGLAEEQLAGYDADRIRDYSFDRDAQKERQFIAWLEEQQEKGVLSVIQERDNTYVKRSYERGIANADRYLQREGIELSQDSLQMILNQPVHQDKLELLYTRNYQALRGITDEVDREVSRVLTDSLSEGVNPRVAARRLTDRVDKIGKTRATVMARTELLNSHNEAALTRYEQALGSNAEIEVLAEVATAGDDRVCSTCSPMHGATMPIQEARENGPPFHAQCRCTYIPSFENT